MKKAEKLWDLPKWLSRALLYGRVVSLERGYTDAEEKAVYIYTFKTIQIFHPVN